MAEQRQQQQDFRQGLQHLAHLAQDSAHQQAALVPQLQLQQGSGLSRWATEAALEAHLQQQGSVRRPQP